MSTYKSEYQIWNAMKQRCANKNNPAYGRYGGRGIKVCDRWIGSFTNFLEDMGERPSKKHSLDRHPNNDGNYEPGNVRWGTDDEQARNKRNNRWFEADGKKMIMQDWAAYFGVNESTLLEHLETKSFDTVFSFYEQKRLKTKTEAA